MWIFIREKKLEFSDLSALFSINISALSVTRKRLARKNDVTPTKESGMRRLEREKSGNDAYFNPEGAVAPRQRRQFSGANLPPARIHGVYSTSSV